jgi:hypothetical protein
MVDNKGDGLISRGRNKPRSSNKIYTLVVAKTTCKFSEVEIQLNVSYSELALNISNTKYASFKFIL